MLNKVEKERAAVGLETIEETRSKYAEDFDIIQVVNAERAGLGLKPLEMCREDHATLLEKQRDETLEALKALECGLLPCTIVVLPERDQHTALGATCTYPGSNMQDKELLVVHLVRS